MPHKDPFRLHRSTDDVFIPSVEGVRAAIEQSDPRLVFIDYFDTLVSRAVSPRQVKALVARQLSERFDVSPSLLVNARRAAEAEGSKLSVERGFDAEHRIDDVAALVWRDLPVGGVDETRFVSEWIAIELGVEQRVQVANSGLVSLLRAESAKRSIALVSDFYIPRPHFEEMLAWHGIGDLFDEVVVSCEVGLSKASGRLYRHLLDTQVTTPALGASDVLMVGDNRVSDGERAIEAGLQSCLVSLSPRTLRAERARSRLQDSWPVRRRSVMRALGGQASPGFAELAVTLHYFTRTLYQRAKSDDCERLVFLAREGQFLKALFDTYQQLTPASAGAPIESDYLLVSRRSTALPALSPFEEEDFSSLLDAYPRMTYADLFGSLGLDDAGEPTLAADIGVDAASLVDVDVLRGSQTFQRQYTHRRLEQRELLQEYVRGVAGGSQKLFVVDVGWKGTIQDHLQRALDHEITLQGYYIGVLAATGDAGSDRTGLLFDSRAVSSNSFRILRHFKSIYEYLLQANHGSASGYRRASTTAPSVDAERYQRSDIVPVLDSQEQEAQAFRVIAPIQTALLEHFAALCRADTLYERPLVRDLDELSQVHSRLLFFPTSTEIELLRSLEFYENFGLMGFSDVSGPTSTGPGRLRQKMAVLSRPDRLLANGWPPLRLTQAGLGSLVPLLGTYRHSRDILVPRWTSAVRRRAR